MISLILSETKIKLIETKMPASVRSRLPYPLGSIILVRFRVIFAYQLHFYSEEDVIGLGSSDIISIIT